MNSAKSYHYLIFIFFLYGCFKQKPKKWVEHRNIGMITSYDHSTASLFECEDPSDFINLQMFVQQFKNVRNNYIMTWGRPLPNTNVAYNFYKFNCRLLFQLDLRNILFLSQNEMISFLENIEVNLF